MPDWTLRTVMALRPTDYTVTDNGNGTSAVVDNQPGSPEGTDLISGFDNLLFKSLPTSTVTIAGTPTAG